MNNYGYLLSRMSGLEWEKLATLEGKVDKLRELSIIIGEANTPQDVIAKMELEKQSFEDADDDIYSKEWYHRQGEKEALELADDKLKRFLHDIDFVLDYQPERKVDNG